MAQMVKRLPAMRETRVQSLGWEDLLEKEMTTHSSTLAWKIPLTEEPGRLQSMGSQRVRHYWTTSLSLSFTRNPPVSRIVGQSRWLNLIRYWKETVRWWPNDHQILFFQKHLYTFESIICIIYYMNVYIYMNVRVENIKMCAYCSALGQKLKCYQYFCICRCAPPYPISLLYIHFLVITSAWYRIMVKNAGS